MPVGHQEKLFGLPGPQNSAVLMDIITKLKHDLQQSKAENHKLVDQLNCLISLVKRAWSGEHGAMLHLANIVGIEAPNFEAHDVNRNTPVADKTRAVKNWERFTVKLLEREYAAIQDEIRERQKLHMANRQLYMSDVLEDHKQEMSKFQLHKNSAINIADVDKQFLKCYNAKGRDERRVKSAYRPRSGYRLQKSCAADMAERSEVKVEDILGQQGSNPPGIITGNTAAFSGIYKQEGEQRRLYRRRENFDDANRYKQINLFDPDVIFSPELLGPPRDTKGRPFSATVTQPAARSNSCNRPKSAPRATVFITEAKPERPLKYETTRPVSGYRHRPASGTSSVQGRRHSVPTQGPVPTSINRKELHSRTGLDFNIEPEYEENYEPEIYVENHSSDGNFNENHHGNDDNVVEKPPIKVMVTKGHPMDKFVEDLKLANEMELDFKKSAVELQKKLGLESSGFVY